MAELLALLEALAELTERDPTEFLLSTVSWSIGTRKGSSFGTYNNTNLVSLFFYDSDFDSEFAKSRDNGMPE